MLLGKTKHKIKELETDDGIIILKKKNQSWIGTLDNTIMTRLINVVRVVTSNSINKQLKKKISESTGLTFRI